MNNREQEIRTIKQRYNITGNCDALNHAILLATKVAQADFSVLILGENGVGKEVFPRIIHDLSSRKNKKYLAVNCGALPEGTIESELFGHSEGAFTGSVGKREGYFATADGGTLFLDEIGELPMHLQSTLLRVLETGEFIPVGSSEARKTNVRVIAATNVNMARAIEEGRFRQDLFYRLKGTTISIPPLRDRGADINMLFRKFALEYQETYHRPAIRLNEEAQVVLAKYLWPGNIRELKRLVESMSVICDEREITADVLSERIHADTSHTQLAPVSAALPAVSAGFNVNRDFDALTKHIQQLTKQVQYLTEEVAILKQQVSHSASAPQGHFGDYGHLLLGNKKPYEDFTADDFEVVDIDTPHTPLAEEAPESTKPKTRKDVEREMIQQALLRNNGNRRAAAAECDIAERTLYRKIKEYGLDE